MKRRKRAWGSRTVRLLVLCLLLVGLCAHASELGTSRIPNHGELIRDRLADGSVGPEMVFLRGGRFQMGSPTDEVGRDDEDEHPHPVTVADVWVGRTELTVGEFRRFVSASGYRTDAERNVAGESGCFTWDMADDRWAWHAGRSWHDPGFDQGDNEPVVCVSWNDAQAYVVWLSSQTGETYRLPTETEWEYAARAGTTTSRFWGDDPDEACAFANAADETPGPDGSSWVTRHNCRDGHWYPAPVGSYRPNPWGLSDMLGNVWEWTCSAYDDGYGGAEARCDAVAEARSGRGGAWYHVPARVRAAARGWFTPTDRYVFMGFRPARSP